MKNRIAFNRMPQDFFFVPGQDPGMTFLEQPDWVWRTHEKTAITGVPLSAYDVVNDRISLQIRRTHRLRDFSKLITFNTVPVVLENARYVRSFVSANNKWILNGETGRRLRNAYANSHPFPEQRIDDLTEAYFAALQDISKPGPMPVTDADVRDLDFVVESRNTFNYFHFLTETLIQLCALDGLDHRGRIIVHYPNQSPSGFVMAFIETLFPELADRVELVRTPAVHDRILSVFNMRHYYYQTSDAVVPSLEEYAPKGSWMWQGRKANRHSQNVLWQNVVDTNLIKLRARALRRVKDYDASHLPRRFWVARSDSGARNRAMKGEAELVAKLEQHGFETVYFEKLKPIDQIALMANAEVMISYHGAGYTNMLFANENAHVIEIGTLQTALYRWNDFMPLAHVAGCRYTAFFADHNTPDPTIEPDFSKESIVPVAADSRQIDVIATFVAALFERPGAALAPADVGKLANALVHAKLPGPARAFIDRHADLLGEDFELTRSLADLCHATGEYDAALDAMSRAYDIDPSRHRLLQRMVYLSRKTNRKDMIPAILEEMREKFPNEYKDFREKLTWYAGPFA